MKTILATMTLGLFLTLTTTATATPLTQVQQLGIMDIDFDTFNYPFDQFDDQGGTLQLLSVTLEVSIDHAFSVEYTNSTASPVTMEVVTAEQSYGFGGPSGLGVNHVLDLSDKLGNYNIPANDSIIIDFYDVHLNLSDAINSNLAPYIGTGIVGIELEHDGVPFFGEIAATGAFGTSIENLSGTVTLTYSYVPEPGSLALVGMASVGLLLRRNRR